MAKCFKAVHGGIRTYTWTSARSHADHLMHYATASLTRVSRNGRNSSKISILGDFNVHHQLRLNRGDGMCHTGSPRTWRISAWRNSLLAVGWPQTTECMLGDLNSNLAVPWRPHSDPCGSLLTSDVSLHPSECSVRVPFNHFVCATLCSANVGMNSGNLPPTWLLPAQQVVPVVLEVGMADMMQSGPGHDKDKAKDITLQNEPLLWALHDTAQYFNCSAKRCSRQKIMSGTMLSQPTPCSTQCCSHQDKR
ncbi:hypothetical protein E2C01_027650 [Portunus trituberculatus]|uniref:Endonuclease/exonuclease/phosphatase domain-containing protein n=1 Tax=Portunus trituberculatus TaxID=210409 RepID=A0A5B7ELW1_PORTR|nr:hypothetical protein [Portunus trituberculatus]